jgi:enamine deaminase RidA (YjgF/YER057c/UK114 family)
MMLGSSPIPEEPLSGFPRVIRLGQQVFVSGSTSANRSGRIRGAGDVRAQMLFALENLESALGTVGADRRQIKAVRAFLTDSSQSEEVTGVYREFFAGSSAPPLRIQDFTSADPLMLVEIEADALLEP